MLFPKDAVALITSTLLDQNDVYVGPGFMVLSCDKMFESLDLGVPSIEREAWPDTPLRALHGGRMIEAAVVI